MVVAMLATFASQTVVKPDCRRRTVTGISPRCQAGCNELENCARDPMATARNGDRSASEAITMELLVVRALHQTPTSCVVEIEWC
jgi:hypothetical protein